MFVLFAGGGVSATEQEETIVFSEQGYSNNTLVSRVVGTNIQIDFYKGTNSNNGPTYYDSGSAVRAYGGNYFTVTAKGNNITKIVIRFGSGDGNNTITTDVGTYNNGTWEGTANSVTFTIGGTSGNRRIASIAVTYVSEQGQGTLDPQNSFANAVEYAKVGEPYPVQEITTLSTGRKSYESSEESVATIDGSGNVTLKKAGETTITVTTAADANYMEGSASYTLIVSKGTPVLSFASENVTAYVGKDQNGPTLTNPGDGAVTYEISDPEVATIQSTGYIHPLKEGTATVTATSTETEAWESATATYTLTVEKAFSVDAKGTYELVSDATSLNAGDQILIAYITSGTNYVLGEKKTNNFGITSIYNPSVSADKTTFKITNESPVTAAILEGSSSGWYFHTNEGYLCATSSSSNNLGAKPLASAGDNAKANISISDGNATIEFLGNYSRNLLKYNSF